jgi:hypothetical protein
MVATGGVFLLVSGAEVVSSDILFRLSGRLVPSRRTFQSNAHRAAAWLAAILAQLFRATGNCFDLDNKCPKSASYFYRSGDDGSA